MTMTNQEIIEMQRRHRRLSERSKTIVRDLLDRKFVCADPDATRELALLKVEAAEVIDEQAQGLNDPEATIVFQPAAGDSAAATQAPVTIKIGALVPGKEDQRYAARSGFAYAVSVSKFSSERALSVTLKELLATAKTAEAAGTPKPGAAVGK